MSRCYFGAALLLLLLVLALAVTYTVPLCQEPTARELQQASQAALREDWDKANRLIRSAESRWQNWWKFSASVTDHGPMEAIDGLFAQLATCLQNRDTGAVAALCAELSRQVEAIADAQRPNWWNLL